MELYNECEVCLEEFDEKLRIPKILIECGHTFCLKCLEGLYKPQIGIICPSDQTSITFQNPQTLPTNYYVLKNKITQLQKPSLKNSAANVKELCSEHEQKQLYFCFTCGIYVCIGCITAGDHKTHDAKDFKNSLQAIQPQNEQIAQQYREIQEKNQKQAIQLQKSYEQVKQACEQTQQEFNGLMQQFQEFLLEKIQQTNMRIQNEADQVLESIKQKENAKYQLLEEIQKLIDQQQQSIAQEDIKEALNFFKFSEVLLQKIQNDQEEIPQEVLVDTRIQRQAIDKFQNQFDSIISFNVNFEEQKQRINNDQQKSPQRQASKKQLNQEANKNMEQQQQNIQQNQELITQMPKQ